MSELRSVLDQLGSTPADVLSNSELAAEIVEAVHAQQMLDVLIAGWTKTLADRDGHAELGYPSPTAFLTHQGRMSASHARQVVSRVQAADKAPAAYRAWADGRLSTDQARHLFAAAESVPDEYPDAEETLVEALEGLSVIDTAEVVEYWRQAVDGPGELDPEKQQNRRGLSLSKTINGMRRVDGWLTSTAGEAFEAALAANMPPPGDHDHRAPRQRRHDALEDLCRDWLDHGDTPQVGGEKPHIMVLSDLDALQGIAGGTHETVGGDIIDVDTLRALACDCSISRIILGPDSEVLDIGRKTRVWTPAQRRAVIARDRHCQAPGCERDARWCDIHHIDHWADGGITSVDKGKLFCRWHHVREHIAERIKRRIRRRS
jgi:hypothetical protein